MGSARQNRKMATRRAQREAGPALHPRRLARSIGKELGEGKDWRGRVAGLPAKGQRFLHPERRQERRIARVGD